MIALRSIAKAFIATSSLSHEHKDNFLTRGSKNSSSEVHKEVSGIPECIFQTRAIHCLLPKVVSGTTFR